jgi:MoaA/NifB/PqqE/SkfB family radical SAM enzyme
MFVLSNLNYNKIDRIVSILKELNVNYFFMQPLRVDCDDYKDLELSEQQKKEFLKKIPETEKLLKEANIMSNINDFKINDNFIANSRDYKSVIPDTVLSGRHIKIGCYFPLITIAIHHDGVIPKCYFAKPIFDRNYFSISSLKEEIMNAGYLDFIKNFIGENCLSNCDKCRICILSEIEEIKKAFINFNKERQ